MLRCAIRDSEAASYHKYFWYKMDWEQIKRKRAVERELLESGCGSNPRDDYSAQKEWLRLMHGEKVKQGYDPRAQARNKAVKHSSSTGTVKSNGVCDAKNSTNSIVSQNPFAVLELDETGIADSA